LTVSVRLLGPLGRLAGQRETRVDVDGPATVLDVLTALAARYGPEFASAVFRAPREVHTFLRVFLGEEEASVERCLTAGGEASEIRVLVVPGFEGGR
jgi:hypothetical protein